MNRTVPMVLILLLSLLLVWLLITPQPQEGWEGETPVRGGGFTLQSEQGPLSLRDLRGKVVLIYFGYTWCPDVCPTNLALMAAAFSDLDTAELQRVQGIFISVDPHRDTPQRLTQYTDYFHNQIIGITGSEAEIAKVAAQYGVAYQLVKQGSATDYVVDHSSETYLVDGTGTLVEILPHAAPAAEIVQRIRVHLPLP